MTSKISPALVAFVLVGLVIGAAAGYFVSAGEVSAVRAELAKVKESKSMLEEELRARTVAVPFVAEKGLMAHDLWLIIAPIQGGKFAVTIRAEGLDQKGGIFLVEGVQRTDKKMVPLAPNMAASEFSADDKGIAVYWVVLDKDPRGLFEKVVVLFLPGMQMDRAILVATATLP